MNTNSIKVVAPASNPHICYIPREYEEKLAYVRKHTGMSTYRLLCASAGTSLSDKTKIHAFKKKLRSLGYKNIGEWACCMIDKVCASKDFKNIPSPEKKGTV